MLVALGSLPLLVRYAGTDRLGYLGLAWALIGYFALLDLGLSRVVTRRIALAHTQQQLVEEALMVKQLCLRLFIAVALIAFLLALLIPAQWVIGKGASIILLNEATIALPILWATVPATVVTGLLRGVLEGQQRFARANLLRGGFGIWSFAAPVAVLPWSHELPALTIAIAVGRYLALLAHIYIAFTTLPRSPSESTASTSIISDYWAMIKEGSWLTISNVVGPVMVTFDRFAVAAIISLAAAGFYFVPQELALRLLIIPSAIATTIFPMLAISSRNISAHREIPNQALLATVIASLPACVILAGFAEPGLRIWMGSAFAETSAPIMTVLAIGLFANCCAQIPFAWIQASGRADITGKLHLLQLPIYCVLMPLLTWYFGLLGTAWCWTLRALADSILQLGAAKRLFPQVNIADGLSALSVGIATMLFVYIFVHLQYSPWRWIGLTLALCVTATMCLRWSKRLRQSLY